MLTVEADIRSEKNGMVGAHRKPEVEVTKARRAKRRKRLGHQHHESKACHVPQAMMKPCKVVGEEPTHSTKKYMVY